jgi:hypothetical protein
MGLLQFSRQIYPPFSSLLSFCYDRNGRSACNVLASIVAGQTLWQTTAHPLSPPTIVPMFEVWLNANRRILALGAVLPAALACLGMAIGAGWLGFAGLTAARWLGWGLAAASLLALASLAWQAQRPRLAYQSGKLLVYLRSGAPIRVPLEIVEGFLLGQGPSFLPGKRQAETEASTLVIRLAERAEEWAQVEVKPMLGYWCGHYITIRGAWCEPLSVDLVNRLNARLDQVKRQLRDAQVAS